MVEQGTKGKTAEKESGCVRGGKEWGACGHPGFCSECDDGALGVQVEE